MPQKNVDKQYEKDTFYHVYNHAVGDYRVFDNPKYCKLFLRLMARYLDEAEHKDYSGHLYPKLNNQVEINALCLLPNHFHLLVYNKEKEGVNMLIKRVLTAFSLIVNNSEKRRGALFETTFKAALIDSDAYLMHISRYIHLNPLDFNQDHRSYLWSSYRYYVNNDNVGWINTNRILSLFNDDKKEYAKFVDEGVDNHTKRKQEFYSGE